MRTFGDVTSINAPKLWACASSKALEASTVKDPSRRDVVLRSTVFAIVLAVPSVARAQAAPDATARGHALRADLESRLAAIPPPKRRDWFNQLFVGAPWLGTGATDVSDILRRYMPAGTSFAEAEAVLAAAGIPMVEPRPTAAQRQRLQAGDEWPIEASLQTLVGQPPALFSLRVSLRPATPGATADDDPVGRIEAGLSRPGDMLSPPVEFLVGVAQPWRVEVPLRIEERRDYRFGFGLRGSRIDDLRPQREPAAEALPTLVVPIHLEIWKADLTSRVFDRTLEATGDRRGGRLQALRIAEGVRLSAGRYLVRITALASVPVPPGTRLNLVVR